MANYNKIVMSGGRRYRPKPGNINLDKTELRDKQGEYRTRHGSLAVYFIFPPGSRISAIADIEALMEDRGYELGVHYNIPEWNWVGPIGEESMSYTRRYVTVMFTSEEIFIMAKLSGDFDYDDES
jgi:long-subunit fatty acid transport protein